MSNARTPRRWVYEVLLGKWLCLETGAYDFPSRGDYYSDAGEWRVWQ